MKGIYIAKEHFLIGNSQGEKRYTNLGDAGVAWYTSIVFGFEVE